jgi:phospholipid/cholesterol/gamma-HCH transport system substrate-binding protein
MEVHARYTLMGLFALAVIGAGFAFVYWLEAGGGFAERVSYRIRFGDPVAGVAKGSAVLFNGVRIGEVTSLNLDAARPSDVMLEVAVDRKAPVRADTKAAIEFQGLAGAPTVALTGGSPELPLLASANAGQRSLTAEPRAGQSMTEAARDVLRNLDGVITDNAAPLKSAIASIDKFTAALARNSDKVDGILAGLDRLTGGGQKPQLHMYELSPASAFPPIASLPPGQLQIPEPTTLAHLENEKILLDGGEKGRLEDGQWADVLPRVVQSALIRSFENAGYKRVLGRAPEGVKTDYQLLGDIRRFQITSGPTPHADVEIGAKVVKADGSLSDVKVFRAQAPSEGIAAPQATAALRRAFEKVAADIVVWALGAVQ